MAFWKKSEDPWDIDPDERRLASEPAEKPPVCWIPSGGIGTLCGRNGRRNGKSCGCRRRSAPGAARTWSRASL